MKICIFGGTFNPIHYGHLRAAEEVREKLQFNKMLFIPSGNPPLKIKDITDAGHRYEMVRLAIADNPFFELSDIECKKKGKSYSVKTLEELKVAYPQAEIFFMLGIDAFLDIPNWWNPERLLALAHFIIISRPGFRFIDLLMSPYIIKRKNVLNQIQKRESVLSKVPLISNREGILFKLTPIGISSTEIRRLIKLGRSIKYLLPPEVQSYIIRNKLYKS